MNPIQFGNTYHIVCKRSDLEGANPEKLSELQLGNSYFQEELLPDLKEKTEDELDGLLDDFISPEGVQKKDVHVKLSDRGDYLDFRLETPFEPGDRIVDARLKYAFFNQEGFGLTGLVDKLTSVLDNLTLRNATEIVDLTGDNVDTDILDDPLQVASGTLDPEKLRTALNIIPKTPENMEKLEWKLESAVFSSRADIVEVLADYGVSLQFDNETKATCEGDTYKDYEEWTSRFDPKFTTDDPLGEKLLNLWLPDMAKVFPVITRNSNLDLNSPLGNLILTKLAMQYNSDGFATLLESNIQDISVQSLTNIIFNVLKTMKDVDKRVKGGNTFELCEENIKTLIDTGADLTATNEAGQTPYEAYKSLHGTFKRKLKGVKSLLKSGSKGRNTAERQHYVNGAGLMTYRVKGERDRIGPPPNPADLEDDVDGSKSTSRTDYNRYYPGSGFPDPDDLPSPQQVHRAKNGIPSTRIWG